MAKRRDFHKTIIGRAEHLHIGDGDIFDAPAKIDTGAYRNAIHAVDIRENGKILTFTLFGGHQYFDALAQPMTTKRFKKVWISNSFGHREERYEVPLRVTLGFRTFKTTFTLADRSKKAYPILIGRVMLNGRFIVDTSKTGIDREYLKNESGIEFPIDEEEGR